MADIQRAHASTPYQQITEQVIGDLQRAYTAGGDLYRVAPWISIKNKRIILAETLAADRFLQLSARQLAQEALTSRPMSDFQRAALAALLLDLPQKADASHEAQAQALLEAAATSPQASPTLEYEPLYRDLAEGALLNNDPVALEWLKRALAHNLRFHEGDDILSDLIDLDSAYLQLGYLDTGLIVLTQLLQAFPDNIWIYRFIATGFPVLGLTALSLCGADRGLALLDDRVWDDEEELRDEFYMARIELQTGATKGRESEVNPEVLAAFKAALQTSFTAGRSKTPQALYDELVPDGDRIPVKAPLRFEDLPEDVQRLVTSSPDLP